MPLKQLWLSVAALTLCLQGCAGADDLGARAEGGAPSIDGGIDVDANRGADSGPAPPMGDGAGLAFSDEGIGFTDSASVMTPAETANCNTALRDTGAASLDCGLGSCEHVASCCVGRGECCGEASGLAPASPDWSMCVGDSDSCAGLMGTRFGSPRPTITGMAFAPGGNGDFDSGLVLDSVVDLRSTRLTLTADFVVPTDCDASCLEGVAVSLSTQDVFDDATHVPVLAGLAMSGWRQRVALIINDREVQHWPATSAATWTLTLSPDGRVDVTDGTDSLLTAPLGYVPAAAARVVISGHDQNPSATHEVASLRTLTIAASRCDIPTGWGAHRDLALRQAGGTVVEPDVEAISTTVGADGKPAMALLIDGNLYTGQRPGTVPTEITLRQSLDNPLLAPAAGETFGAPAFYFAPESSSFVLLLPMRDADGARLMRAVYDPMATPPLGDLTALLGPEPDIAEYASVTLAHAPTARVAMIVRRRHVDGTDDLAVYEASDTVSTTTRLDGLHLEEALSSSEAPGYDADELGGLSLVGTNHAWQLYYARRTGARWSIGLLVSDDLVYWRHAAEGDSVLLGDGSNHEAVGARAPSVTIVNERVTLRYLGLDGSLRWPRSAARWATGGGVWPI